MDDDGQEVSPRALRLKEELLGDFSLRVDDVAAVLEVDRSTVNRYIQDGALVALKIGREYRLSEPDVRDFLQALVARERQRVGGLRMRALTGDGARTGVVAPASGTHFTERFGERAQRALAQAQAQARARAAREVAPEHLLLALLAEDEAPGDPGPVLQALGVDLAALRHSVEAALPEGDPAAVPDVLDFSAACRDVVVEGAPANARHAGRQHVAPEDLLLSLYAIRTIGDLLRQAGASESAIRVEVRRRAPAPAALTEPDRPLRDDVTAMSVWVQATTEAHRRHHHLVTPAHLLLAMLADVPGLHDGAARTVLQAVGADIDALHAAAEGMAPPAAPPAPSGATVISRGGFIPAWWPTTSGGRRGGLWQQAPMIRPLREVDYQAFRAADALGHAQVGAEHVLLGLYALPELAGLLATAGAAEPEVRDAVWRARAEVPPFPRELTCDFNNVGISDDDKPGSADLDGGGRSYSRQALEAAGLRAGQPVDVEGLRFEWPSASPGTPDNVRVMGQVVPLQLPPGVERLGFLGTASMRAARGSAGVAYTDGTTQRFTLGFGDWVLNDADGKSVVTTDYWNVPGHRGKERPHVHFTSVTLRPGKVPAFLLLPTEVDGGRLHLFALAAG